MAFPDFSLTVETTDQGYPNGAVREGIDNIWETQRDILDTTKNQYRRKTSIVFHVDCNTTSTANADFETFLDQQLIASPVMNVGGVAITYSGTWRIERTATTDKANTSRMTTTMFQYGSWVDEDGNPV